MTETITYLCDNTDSVNWGCRGTSLALHELLHRDHREVRSFPRRLGVTTIARLPNLRLPGRMARFADSAAGRAYSTLGAGRRALGQRIDAVNGDFDASARRLEVAARSNPRWAELLDAVRSSTAVVINGEGSMIFTTPPRRDLFFQMTVARLAQRVGVPVHYVNALVSPCPSTGEHAETIAASLAVLAECASVMVRDPVSAGYLAQLGYTSANVTCVPDALFTWSTWEEARQRPTALAQLEAFPERSASFAARPSLPSEYLALSGASVSPGGDREGWTATFTTLTQALRRDVGLPVVLVVPDEADAFLNEVAQQARVPVVGPSTPLLLGCGLLANAQAYVSGRYHPSIMAALGGTPLVSFHCNSHKLDGLSHWLFDELPDAVAVTSSDFVDRVVDQVHRAVAQGGSRIPRRERALALGDQARTVYEGLVHSSVPATPSRTPAE